jgi:hypothetical protein
MGKPLKKTHTWSGGTGVRTRDLPNVKWRARRLATKLGLTNNGIALNYIRAEADSARDYANYLSISYQSHFNAPLISLELSCNFFLPIVKLISHCKIQITGDGC